MANDIENGGMREFASLIVDQLREQREALTRLSERVEKVNDGMGDLREVKVKLENLQESVNSLKSVDEKTTQLEHRVSIVEQALESNRVGQDKRMESRLTVVALVIALVAAVGSAYPAYQAYLYRPLPAPAVSAPVSVTITKNSK